MRDGIGRHLLALGCYQEGFVTTIALVAVR
jgi:hypothetical protein